MNHARKQETWFETLPRFRFLNGNKSFDQDKNGRCDDEAFVVVENDLGFVGGKFLGGVHVTMKSCNHTSSRRLGAGRPHCPMRD